MEKSHNQAIFMSKKAGHSPESKKIPAGETPTGMEITENVIYLARRALRAAS